MNEAEWLTEDDLEYLLDCFKEKASRRKLRLFAIGCVRSILHLLPDQLEFPTKSRHRVNDYSTCSYSAGEMYPSAE